MFFGCFQISCVRLEIDRHSVHSTLPQSNNRTVGHQEAHCVSYDDYHDQENKPDKKNKPGSRMISVIMLSHDIIVGTPSLQHDTFVQVPQSDTCHVRDTQQHLAAVVRAHRSYTGLLLIQQSNTIISSRLPACTAANSNIAAVAGYS